jgi:hypothetical protein
MTERVKSGLTWRGLETDFTVELVRHRQTKETEQIGFTYGIPRQSSTLPHSSFVVARYFYRDVATEVRSSLPVDR